MIKEAMEQNRHLYYPQRLRDIYDCIDLYPLTVIEAPMGYGKTTLTRDWLRRSGYRYVWKHIYDRAIEEEWDDFFSAFSEIIGESSDKLMDYSFQESIRFAQKIAGFFRKLRITEPTVIVLDDYHLLNSKMMDTLIELIAEDGLANLHIVLTLRSQHFNRLEELSLKGCLYHISKDEVAFTCGEIKRYYKSCGLKISHQESQALFENTEGWISAIYLTMLAYRKNGQFTPANSIYKLLENSIYRPLTDEMKNFLQHLCVVDAFTRAQANYIWPGDNSDLLLGQLGSHMFINYDPLTQLYNIHSIFAGFLRKLVKETCLSCLKDIYRRNGLWYLKQGDCYKARHYLYMAGDFEGLLESLSQDNSNSYSCRNKEAIKKYMSECPVEVKKGNYYGLLAYILHLIAHHDYECAKVAADELADYIEADDRLSETEKNKFRGELVLINGLKNFSDLKKVGQAIMTSWQLMGSSTSMKFRTNNWTFASPSVLGLYYSRSGHLLEHLEDMNTYMPYYYRLTNGHGTGGEEVMEAEYFYYKGDFETALIHAESAYINAQIAGEDITFAALFIKVRACMMSGRLDKAFKYIEIIHHSEVSRRIQSSIHISRLCEGYIYTYLGLLDRVPEQLLEDDLPYVQLMYPCKPFYHLIYGKIMLEKKTYTELIGIATYFLDIALEMKNLLGQVYTYIYMSAAYRGLFKEDEAQDYLLKALEIAMPDSLYMAFVENSEDIIEVLVLIQNKGLYMDEIDEIRSLSKTYTANKQVMLTYYNKDSLTTLTLREMEIAELATEGKTNAQIGQALFISENTVKKAIRSIYSKLHINNRTLLKQAMARGKIHTR